MVFSDHLSIREICEKRVLQKYTDQLFMMTQSKLSHSSFLSQTIIDEERLSNHLITSWFLTLLIESLHPLMKYVFGLQFKEEPNYDFMISELTKLKQSSTSIQQLDLFEWEATIPYKKQVQIREV